MPYENRLGRYAVFASVAPLASAAVTNSVVADIYHQADVGLIVGGFGAFPEAKLLSIPEYGAMRVIAGHDSQGPGFMGISSKVEDADGTEFRYGWIALDWDVTTFELTIEAFAYETEAGVGIAAGAIPAPGAMGLFGLAAGAAGIRRKRQA